MNAEYMTENEIKMHPLIKNSFAFVPSAGMRVAPEVLLLELFREIFYEKRSEDNKTKEIIPEEKTDNQTNLYTLEERAIIYALRGRRKKKKQVKAVTFFAPAYPPLAKYAWLRPKGERVIVNFLLGSSGYGDQNDRCAPISQHLWHGGITDAKKEEQREFAEAFVSALIGGKSYQDLSDSPKGKDILSVPIQSVFHRNDKELALRNLIEKTKSTNVIRLEKDELSSRVFNDLMALFKLENKIPRLQWLQVFMTYLRFSLPMWLLAQMQITAMLHKWFLDAVERGEVLDTKQIKEALASRNRGLLHPSLTPTNEIIERIEQYMRQRIELNILLYELEKVLPYIREKRLSSDNDGATVISVEQLLLKVKDIAHKVKASEYFKNVVQNGSINDFLIREAESCAAWCDPLHKGQGKNIDEFFRVLYRDFSGDELGGALLIPSGNKYSKGFVVFPGQLLLKTITILANYDKRIHDPAGGGGSLVLEDVENHFYQYGIDFSYAADARPLLINNLKEMGLLKGSPDAGSSVAVACPY